MKYQAQSFFLKIVMVTIMIFGALNCAAQEVLQKQEMAPSNNNDSNAFFGEAVDIYGGTMVVGSAFNSSNQLGANKVYVYERQNSVWVEKQVLIPDDFSESDYVTFGYTVSIDGNFIAIGGNEVLERYPPDDFLYPNEILSSRGVVFVFELAEGLWVQVEKFSVDHLTNSPNDSTGFGNNLSVFGNTLVVASANLTVNGIRTPTVFVYENQETSWVMQTQLSPPCQGCGFGRSVAINANTIAVASYLPGRGSDGFIQMYERVGENWLPDVQLVPSDGIAGRELGNRLSLHQDSLLAGAIRDNDNGALSGAAYEFERTGGVWIETNKIKPSVGGSYQFFSYALDHNGETAVVSEYRAYSGTPPDPNYFDHFASSIFKKKNSVWTEVATLEPFPQDIDPYNGDEVALSGNTIAVANKHYAPGMGLGNQGRVWMYELEVATDPETPTGQDVEVTPTVEDLNGDPVEGSPEFNFTYQDVDAAGETTIVVVDPSPETTTPPQGFSILGLDDGSALFDFDTTATLAPGSTVEVCIDYSSMNIAGDPADLVFAHEVGGVWVDITSSNDLGNEIICGVTDSFSFFALIEAADPVQLLSGLVTAVEVLNAKHGIINSLDAKLDSAEGALSDAKVNNDHSAINVLMNGFISHVEAQSGKSITTEEADGLIYKAAEIVAVIEGGLSL